MKWIFDKYCDEWKLVLLFVQRNFICTFWIWLLPTVLFSQSTKTDLHIDGITASLKKNARAVVRYDNTVVNLFSDKKYEVTYDYAITILKKKAEHYLDFNAFYKDGSERIKDIKINYFDKEGQLLKRVQTKEIEDRSALSGYELIGDSRRKNYDYEAPAYPITVTVSYKKESANTMHLPSWHPFYEYRTSVASSTYQIKNSTISPVITHTRNLKDYNSIARISENEFVMEDQRAVVEESFCPPIYEIFPMVYARPTTYSYEGITGSHQTWDDFGRWMYKEFLKDKSNLKSNHAKLDLDGIINERSSDYEKVSTIYNYVQEQTRYVYIGLDEGGYAPLSAQKVHDVKYGDCKALSFYMKSLLELYDIPANYVIVHAKTSKPTDLFLEFPDTRPSNHVILNVPLGQDTVWLDCTSDDNPMNFLGRFTDDRWALELRADGANVVRTPMYSDQQNRYVMNNHIVLDEDGNVEVKSEIANHGLMIEKGLYVKDLDEEDYIKYVKSDILEDFDRIEIIESDYILVDDDLRFDENYHFKAAEHGQKAGDYLLLPLSLFDMPVPKFKKDKKRNQEIVLSRGYSYEYTDTYELPLHYRWELPEDVILTSPYGDYKCAYKELKPNVYQVRREFTYYKGRYPAVDYNSIKTAFDKIRKQETTKFSITKKS